MADQPTSRRSFLFGRSFRDDDPWLRFLARLKRSCEGSVSLVRRESAPMARLVPSRQKDVYHALSLCKTYRVCMALDGLPLTGVDLLRPVLQVEAGRAWATIMPMGEQTMGEQIWRVQAGCSLEAMRAAGINVYAPGLPAQTSLAQWFALLQPDSPPGTLDRYAVQAIEWLYPDGSIEVLGQFGVQDSQPLRSIAAQRSIPKLFQLTADPWIEQWSQAVAGQIVLQQHVRWPLHYRLDALMSQFGSSVNLAHLLLGHRGSLGWVIAAHMRQVPPEDQVPVLNHQQSDVEKGQVQSRGRPEQAHQIDQKIKYAMDPDEVFLSCPDQTG